LQGLADLATKSHQVLLLPLLATTAAWQQRLAAQPYAAPLAAMLGSLAGKLKGQWASFTAGQVAAVEQYDSRSKMGLQQGASGTGCLRGSMAHCLLTHHNCVQLFCGW
jgi:hypothetical protein